MRLPKGVTFQGQSTVRLLGSLYGLKQSGHVWHEVAHKALIELGFIQNRSDIAVYSHPNGSFLALYVDDFIYATSNHNDYLKLCKDLSSRFEIDAIGEATSVLGIRITKHQTNSFANYSMDQSYYIDSILEDFNMSKCNPVATPMAYGTKLSMFDCPTTKEEVAEMAKIPYRELIGKVMYLMTSTRPDIAHCVGVLSRYLNNPGQAHWTAAKHLLAYLKNTKLYQLTFTKDEGELVGYTDSDWAGTIDNRHSTSGYVFTYANCAITWRSGLQDIVATSTTEAEYIGMYEATKEAIWLRSFFNDLLGNCLPTTTIFGDNLGSIQLSGNPVFHRRTKHIDVKYHSLREQVQSRSVKFTHIPTNLQVADIFTKAIPKLSHFNHVNSLGLVRNTSQD